MSSKPKSVAYRARRIHRFLGVVIGVQFLLWTAGGLYFSWVSLDAVHGDHLHRAPPLLAGDVTMASPAAAVRAIRALEPVDSLAAVELANVLGRPTYRIRYVTHGADGRAQTRTRLADGATGAPRPAVDSAEAVALATAAFAGRAAVRGVEYLTPANVGRHHEYREQPLPAWAVRFDHGEGATAYVAAELGQVIRIRNDRWRAFDFLWMLHTMDYRGRDDFNNLALRAFSVFGLATVLSGFVLFALTSPTLRGRRPRGEARELAAPGPA